MKKIGLLIFVIALVVGVGLAKFTSFGNNVIKSPISFLFSAKVKGSGHTITQSRNIGEFKGISVSGILRVKFKQGPETEVKVKADDNIAPLIKTKVSDGVLKIWSEKRYKTRSRVTVFVSSPEIESFDTSGVARIEATNLNAEKLAINSSGASRINAEGKVKNLFVDMSGASRLKARSLVTNKAKVDASGASSIVVNVSDFLDADISGASRVKYTGSVVNLRKSVSGASSISKVD